MASYTELKERYKALKQAGEQFAVTTGSAKGRYEARKTAGIAIQSAEAAREEKIRAEAAREAVMQSLVYASRIQKSLLPYKNVFSDAFSDYAIVWKPRDIVSGDIYWLRSFDEGTVLSVCDCTGHGTPGALLTMLVVSAFGMIVNEETYKDTAKILQLLDSYLVATLYETPNENPEDMADIRDGCDLAVLYIPKKGDITFSSANFPVFECDGETVKQHKGQRIFIGEGKLAAGEEVNVTKLPRNPKCKYYISSDGMFDQKGGVKGLPFGYKTFKEIILGRHDESLQAISETVWTTFESYRGEHPRKDDFELVSFATK